MGINMIVRDAGARSARRAPRPASLLAGVMALALVASATAPAAWAQSAPAAPSSVTLTRGAGFIDVSWPTVTGATGHNIVWSTDNKGSWTRAATNAAGTASGTNTTYRIAGTNNLLPYVVAVQATNLSGSSGWTNSAEYGPVLTPMPARNVSVSRSLSQQGNPELTVTWDQCDVSQAYCNGGSSVTGYFVNLSTDSKNSWSRVKTITDPTTDSDVTTVSNPTNPVPDSGFTRYSVTLTSGIYNNLSYVASFGLQNAAGVSWANSSELAASASLSPVDMSELEIHRGNGFIDVVWEPVTGATGYDINHSADDKTSWIRAASNATGTVAGSDLTYRVNSIDNNATYHVAIRPRNTTSLGGWTVSTPSGPAITPAPAWNMNVVRGSSLTVSWDQCDVDSDWCNGGSEITQWAINLRAGASTSPWTQAWTYDESNSLSDAGLTITDDGGTSPGDDRWSVLVSYALVAGTSYTVAVGITNRMGTTWVNYGQLI